MHALRRVCDKQGQQARFRFRLVVETLRRHRIFSSEFGKKQNIEKKSLFFFFVCPSVTKKLIQKKIQILYRHFDISYTQLAPSPTQHSSSVTSAIRMHRQTQYLQQPPKLLTGNQPTDRPNIPEKEKLLRAALCPRPPSRRAFQPLSSPPTPSPSPSLSASCLPGGDPASATAPDTLLG